MAGAQQDHTDYSFSMAASNVLFGGLMGAGFHGLGELAGATWRGALRAGAAALETGDKGGQMAGDIAAMDRSQVVKDLTEQNGAEPSEPEIQAEMQSRQQAFVEKVKSGEYQQHYAPEDLPAGDAQAPQDIADLASSGKYDEASAAMQKHLDELQSDPSAEMTPEQKQQAEEPVGMFGKVKGLLDDFTACVAAESA
jgi:hypothetical protein